ncbi:putative nucleobase-ascorbate transporter 9 [Rhododendron vialii]|uniref:putative nucleobase-ascorbate transporter 9 n=1 Tax=Rhododendron vialii TaxID=182163 RepID=UPI00265DC495|nr:putative nucleobase-ascorbate transporter 9 [Rhododendron vialii]
MAAVAAATSVAVLVSTMELRWRTYSHTQGWNSSQGSNIASIVILHGILEVVVLVFQHYLMTLGTTVLIPSMFVNQMGGSNVEKAKVIQTLLFVSGLNTLMQSLFGTRLPSVVGSSYAFVIPMTSILHAGRYRSLVISGAQWRLLHISC